MTPRHITLTAVGVLVGIIATVCGGLIQVKSWVDEGKNAAVQRAVQHTKADQQIEMHNWEIDRRLDRLELAVRMSVSNDSQKQQNLINQVLQMKTQLQQVSQTQDSYVIPKVQRLENNQYPADAPSVQPPQ